MTLAELHQRIGWQLEGRLQIQVGDTNTWCDVTCDEMAPAKHHLAFRYRERPTQPPLPDEVWIAEYQGVQFNSVLGAYKTRERCTSVNNSATPVRYIRADGVIDGARLQSKFKGPVAEWHNVDVCEYRFKP